MQTAVVLDADGPGVASLTLDAATARNPGGLAEVTVDAAGDPGTYPHAVGPTLVIDARSPALIAPLVIDAAGSRFAGTGLARYGRRRGWRTV